MMKITKEMTTLVTSAMTTLMQQKGGIDKMVYAEDIELFLMSKNVKTFVPVLATLSYLIDARYVRFFPLNNKRRVYGYTKVAKDKLEAIFADLDKQKITTVSPIEVNEDEVRLIKYNRMKEQYLEARELNDVERMTELQEQIYAYSKYVKDSEVTA